MKKQIYLLLLIGFAVISCKQDPTEQQLEEWKQEIIKTEADFAQLVAKEGVPKGFLTYAAEDAVLMRNKRVIEGLEQIRAYLNEDNRDPSSYTLSWSPDFVDVSASGDLGYTYGKYIYSTKDSLGNPRVNQGIFHTVWKRQPDGTWKFVWD